MKFIEPVRNFYSRFERPISSLSLIFGFVFDALTLKRLDTLWENFWILGHLVVVGIFIALIHIKDSEAGDEENSSKAHFWYVNILQFFFGGILSTYLVFYFRSTDFFTTWPFLALLLLAFIANESLKRHYIRFSFQVTLFFLSIYSFAIFLVPVVLHKIGLWVFLLSGVISLAIISVFAGALFYFIENKKSQKEKREGEESKRLISGLVLGIFALVNIMYFTNLIPPIPLSLKQAGMYHSIEKVNGNYEVTFEDTGWKGYFQLYPDIKKIDDKPIHAFSAIFSPKSLDIIIVHQWQHYDDKKSEWVTSSRINLGVVGGRDEGFRTYSTRYNLEPGKWRVNIETSEGLVIGRLRFNMVPALIEPVLNNMAI